ncbi:MAG: AhpC/TSA family protein [Anaerolineae bacterium]
MTCREHAAQLCQHQDEFKRLDTEVLIVSFGTLPLAQAWLEETCSPFHLLLDPERTVYQVYGLERSLWRSWNLKTVQRYVQLMRNGRQWRGIQGDSTQLGGDFIVDADGILRLVYPSREATDRPSVEQLFAVLSQLTGKDET